MHKEVTVYKSGLDRCRSSLSYFFRVYCSRIGFKIAVPVALFMMMPILVHVFLDEYSKGGDLYMLVTNPTLWGVIVAAFLALMVVLSKVVILPLKKFETHISELEQGNHAGPIIIDTKDEIGYLADRFNSLHRLVTNEIESRDTQLAVLYEFTNASSGVFDIPVLMDSFFNILSTAVEFDIGAYLLRDHNHVEGKIYSVLDSLGKAEAAAIRDRLAARAGYYCRNFPQDEAVPIEVSRIPGKGRALSPRDFPGHFIDLPIVCRGEHIGVVSLISYSSTGTHPILGAKIFNAMVKHAGVVIEKVLTHISADEKRLQNILSSMSEGVYIIDMHGHATSINKKGLELLEAYCAHSHECGKKGYVGGIGNCPEREGACEFSRLISKVKNFGHEFEGKVHTEEIRSQDGMVVQISVSNLLTQDNRKEGYVITAKDVTEDRLIQKRVMLSGKLAALGEMAAGIAHEVNNPLQVMFANIELLELEPNMNENEIQRLEHLKDGITRIKSIVKDLLIFAREQTTEVEDIEINKEVRKVVDMLGHQLKIANVEVGFDLDRRALPVRCNKNLFQQVIINLLQNAKDAIEESGKGSRVDIRTVGLPGGIVVVEVSDDGPGIPDNVIDRIFDPFFTTKDVGKGTGLGLSVSRRIIEGMGGSISVVSSQRNGTTFTINLLQSRTRRKEAGFVPPELDYTVLKDRSVMIVDDEEGVLRAVKESMLPKVACCDIFNDGQAAIEALMDRDYDAILLDIKMPGVNGMEFYRRISDAKPYLSERVIFLTGDTENEATESFIKLTGCRYLEKPFTLKELLNLMCSHDTGAGQHDMAKGA